MNSNWKIILIILLIVGGIITLFNVMDIGKTTYRNTYGQSNSEAIRYLNQEITVLKKQVSVLKSNNSTLFVLVFISLILNAGLFTFKIVSYFTKSDKDKVSKE